MPRTPAQQVFELIALKVQREAVAKMTNEARAAEYEQNGKSAATTEKVNLSFVETVVYCFNGILSKPGLLKPFCSQRRPLARQLHGTASTS